MSEWIHVIGIIRIAGIRDALSSDIENIESIIGPTNLSYENNYNSTLPKGSEGSIDYKLAEYEEENPWFTISFFGDLRGRNPEYFENIKEWWNQLIDRLNTDYQIGDGVLHMYGVDYASGENKSETLTFENNEN